MEDVIFAYDDIWVYKFWCPEQINADKAFKIKQFLEYIGNLDIFSGRCLHKGTVKSGSSLSTVLFRISKWALWNLDKTLQLPLVNPFQFQTIWMVMMISHHLN